MSTDDEFAYKFSDATATACDFEPCWNVTVIAARGCPDGISIAMNVQNANGSVVDSAQDQVFADIAPGQSVLLKPGYVGASSNVTGVVTNIACEP
jgi:hypothetical protein